MAVHNLKHNIARTSSGVRSMSAYFKTKPPELSSIITNALEGLSKLKPNFTVIEFLRNAIGFNALVEMLKNGITPSNHDWREHFKGTLFSTAAYFVYNIRYTKLAIGGKSNKRTIPINPIIKAPATGNRFAWFWESNVLFSNWNLQELMKLVKTIEEKIPKLIVNLVRNPSRGTEFIISLKHKEFLLVVKKYHSRKVKLEISFKAEESEVVKINQIVNEYRTTKLRNRSELEVNEEPAEIAAQRKMLLQLWTNLRNGNARELTRVKTAIKEYDMQNGPDFLKNAWSMLERVEPNLKNLKRRQKQGNDLNPYTNGVDKNPKILDALLLADGCIKIITERIPLTVLARGALTANLLTGEVEGHMKLQSKNGKKNKDKKEETNGTTDSQMPITFDDSNEFGTELSFS